VTATIAAELGETVQGDDHYRVRIAKSVFAVITVLLIIPVLAIIGYLIFRAWPVLTPSFILENPKDYMTAGGIWAPLVAVDLRFIVAVLKINNDLERIGDLAVNIAQKAKTLAARPPMPVPFDLAGMSEKTQAMLRDSLDSLVDLDTTLANDVCGRDDEIDRMKRDIRRQAEKLIAADPARTKGLLLLLAVSRNLERIADLTTNIAEDVIYLVDGKIIRHGEGE